MQLSTNKSRPCVDAIFTKHVLQAACQQVSALMHAGYWQMLGREVLKSGDQGMACHEKHEYKSLFAGYLLIQTAYATAGHPSLLVLSSM